jgi:hypothetical protein
MQAVKTIVVAEGSKAAAEGALRDEARDRTRLDPRKVQKRNAQPIIGGNEWLILVANSGTGASRARCVTLTHG